MKSQLIAILILLGGLTACAGPQPTQTPDIPATVTAQVEAHLDSVPTATPLPTHTPYPTATPYLTPTQVQTAMFCPTATPRPTYTPYPMATALPTSTPYPTLAALPTYTPHPTAALQPTYTLYPTLIPERAATATRKVVEFTDTDLTYTIDIPEGWERGVLNVEWAEKGTSVGFTDANGVVRISVVTAYSELGWLDDSNSYADGVFEILQETLIEGTFEIWQSRPSPNGGVYISSSYQEQRGCAIDSEIEALALRKWALLVEVFACQRQFSQYKYLLLDTKTVLSLRSMAGVKAQP